MNHAGATSATALSADASRKRFLTGTHRTRTPEETWERIAPCFERVGITRVADVTRLDRIGIPVYQAVRPGSLNLSVSQGKGATSAAARVSCAMEAIELWHAERLDRLPQVSSSLQEMAYGNPIRPEHLRWIRGTRFPAQRIPWVEALSLVSGRRGWLPRGALELDFRVSDWFEPSVFVASSNGLASGNDLNEALLHGLCELVERHAWFLWYEDPGRRVPIDEDSVDSDDLRELMGAIRAAGFRLALHDLSWEAGLPTVLAQIVAPDLPVIWHGAGCHTSPEIALSRAVTEAAQSRLTYIAGAREDLVALVRGARCHRAFDDFVEPASGRPFASLPDVATHSVARDLELVVERLDALDLEPHWVDLTHPEIGIPVVVTHVPGLRVLHV